MRKSVLSLAIVLVLSFATQLGAAAMTFDPPFELQSKGVYMVNLDTDTVILEKNPDEQMYPASTTKIMTAILALENTADLDAEITYPFYVQDIVYTYNVEYNMQLSLSGLLGGEVLSMRKLLYAALLPSGNEAAMIIGDSVGDGSIDYFVEMMNAKAQELGAVNTHFANPAGLHDPENYTTPKDMYLIARYAMENELFREIVSTPSYNGGPTNKHTDLYWNNTNSLLRKDSTYYYAPIKGIKTGTLDASGRCFVSYAEQDGFRYLLVLFGAPITDADGKNLEQNASFVEAKNLYEWAFNTFRVKTVIDEGELREEVPLRLAADKDHVKLMSGGSYTALLPEDVDASSFQLLPDLPESVDAPIEKGTPIGTLRLMLGTEEVASIPLVSAESIERSDTLYLLDQIATFFGSFWFKFLFVFFLLLIVVYMSVMVTRNKHRSRTRRVRRRRNL